MHLAKAENCASVNLIDDTFSFIGLFSSSRLYENWRQNKKKIFFGLISLIFISTLQHQSLALHICVSQIQAFAKCAAHLLQGGFVFLSVGSPCSQTKLTVYIHYDTTSIPIFIL